MRCTTPHTLKLAQVGRGQWRAIYKPLPGREEQEGPKRDSIEGALSAWWDEVRAEHPEECGVLGIYTAAAAHVRRELDGWGWDTEGLDRAGLLA